MHQEFTTIQQLLRYSQEALKNLGKGIYIVGNVSQELGQEIMRVSGLQVTGYRITIDHSAILHILRKHGQATEVLQGQLPMTTADIEQLATELLTPIQVADAGQKQGQLQCLQFELASDTARLLAILEVRAGRKRQQLALKTCYKKRPTA